MLTLRALAPARSCSSTSADSLSSKLAYRLTWSFTDSEAAWCRIEVTGGRADRLGSGQGAGTERVLFVESQQYKNPPIDEAVCEFRFAPGSDWNPMIQARFLSRIESSYDGKSREEPFLLKLDVEGAEAPAVQQLTRVILPDEGGTRQVTLYPNALSVYALRPYKGWSEFRPRISDALNVYQEVAEPAGVRRVGIRYINRMVVPDTPSSISSYFRGGPTHVDGLPQNATSILSRVQFLYEDGITCRLIHSGLDAEQEDHVGFLLDLDLAWTESENEPRAIEDAMALVDDLRDKERSAFESVITDKARKVFNGTSAV